MTLFSDIRTGVDGVLKERAEAGTRLADDADSVAAACGDMAARFHQGGKLIVFGNGAASADADHIAVEFLHPVIVGKRSLPALSLNNDVATITDVANGEGFAHVFAHQMRYFAEPPDIALGISADGGCLNVLRGLEAARESGLLTVALVGDGGGQLGRSPAVEHALIARSQDPMVVKEIHVTTYHILWELVHVFLEQPGVLERPEVPRDGIA